MPDMCYTLTRKIILFLFLALSVLIPKAQNIDRISNSPYPSSRRPDTLFIIDDQRLTAPQQFVVQSLQGILAQYRPKIYRISDAGSLMWLSELHSRYGVFMRDTFKSDYVGLVKFFKDSLDGYILCTMAGPSANAALSLCSQFNAIAVPEGLEKDFPFLKRVLDVRQMTEEDVYAKYHDSLSKNIITYQKEANATFLGDYTVFSGAFRFYEPINNSFTQSVFKDMHSNAALLGWGDDERELVRATSKNSIIVHAADLANNLSVLTNIDATYDQQDSPVQLDTLNAAIHTVCFLMTDGDNIQWLTHDFATSKKWYNADERGSFPLGWTVSPALSELAPPIMKYLYDNAYNTTTGRDYFVAAPSGLGYFYPETFPDMLTNTDLLNKYMKKSDLSIVNVIGNSRNPDLGAYAACSNIDAVFYYMYTDYAGWKGKIMWINDKPVIGGRFTIWGDKDSPETVAQKINDCVKNQFDPEGYSLIPVHVWSNTVEDVKRCVNMLNSDVRVVAPDDFVKLISRNLGIFLYQNYPNPVLDNTAFSFKLPFEQHVTLSVLSSTGEVLKVLYDGDAEAGVTKVEMFRDRDMVAGVYMCQLTTPYQSRTIKFQVYN
jgi:hypothetical protein